MPHIHEQVLEAANRIASQRKDRTFLLDEIVRALPHLNGSSVRTHVVSRCCTNAPKNHLHKWDYFRRVDRGTYQVMPNYRDSGRSAKTQAHEARRPKAENANDTRIPARHARETIHAVVQKDATAYFAECIELGVVTQGATLDELAENLSQAIALHLEDEDMTALGLVDRPRLQILYDVPSAP